MSLKCLHAASEVAGFAKRVAVLGQALLGERHHQDAVRGRDAHAHDRAHQRRHAQGRVR